ncbi:MAG: NlpC/P60 family protein [Candidatus Neomarinimicrobiota bacterium]
MLNEKKSWFIISSGCAPVYEKPDFTSPMLTETLFGESCKIISRDKDWIKINCEDGYVGWMHSFYGSRNTKKNIHRYLVAYPNDNGCFSIKYPFGSMSKNYVDGAISIDEVIGFRGLIGIAHSLLGVPYRWGGKSSLGFDCSGLVQSVLKICGFKIPRDAQDQFIFFQGSRIDLENANVGDLHFFGKEDKVTHVGFSNGGLGLIHAQGYVKIDSLDSSIDSYNKELLDIYLSTYSIKRKFNL